ncbi:MAG TPA: hypothetical protein VMV09_00650, partial [Candidatus Saccharimonadales bacterium]|nr:hypothetical protein [Candidatus Saccharimonadales bacterium]
SYELIDNRRQVGDELEWERTALKELRVAAAASAAGDAKTAGKMVGKAVDAYDRHDRIVYAEGESRAAKAALIAQAAQDYLAAKDRGASVALMAATHKDRISLNAAIRPELIRRGEVAAEGMTVGKLEIAVGDTLMMLKNNQVPGVRNSHLVHVEQINPKLGTAKVRRPDGELVEADRNALAKWAAHGYAETVNKAQGRTVDVGMVLADSPALSSQWGITALTRGREDNRVYFTGPRPADPEHHLPEEVAPSKDEQWKLIAAGLTRDRSKQLASEVIAALDRDDRAAVEARLASTVEETRAAAQKAASQQRTREDHARQEQAAEREEEQRRTADAEFDEHRQEHRARGPQRRRAP